jgi:uncharacterized membrane protein
MHTGVAALLRIGFVGLLPVALYATRVAYSHERTYGFLLFNLLLAALPLFFAGWARHEQDGLARAPTSGRRIRWIAALVLWLFFLPNAPYLVSDFVHLRMRSGVPLWYDIVLLSSFAFAGMVYGVVALSIVHDMVRERVGALVGWLFVGAVAGLAGIGIWIGRFLRWNSWDLFIRPHEVLADAASELAHPLRHPTPWGVTLVFAALLFATYASFRLARNARVHPRA